MNAACAIVSPLLLAVACGAALSPGAARDSDWYKVSLEAGKDYAVSTYANCGLTFGVRDKAGKLLASTKSADEVDTGFEFRPSYTGLHFVEYRQVPSPDCDSLP